MKQTAVNKNNPSKNYSPIVKMENIHKWFGEVHALKGVDFEVRPYEAVGLIGDNGAGKSTLIKILAGLIRANRGKIFFDGKEINIKSVDQARKLGIETVFQEQAIVDSLSVAKNIFLGRERVRNIGFLNIMDEEEMYAETEKLMQRLNLEISTPRQKAKFCSGGERQGIAIARAMFFDAKVLILDEPTRALSVSGVEKVHQYIKHAKEQETGVIYITHDLARAFPVVDRFVFLSRGEKKLDIEKEDCTLDELKNLYRRER